MTSIYQNPTLHIREPGKKETAQTGYDGYVEPDTKIPPKPAKVIKDVTVNGVLIPEADIMAEAQNHPADTPGAALAQAAHALTVRELLLQEAGRLKVEAPATAGDGKRGEAGEDAIIRLLIEQEVDVPQAGEEECRRIYAVNRHRFCSDTIHEARHILFAVETTDAKARDAVRGKAENLAAHLALHPEEFAGAAAEFSDCPSGRQGGNLGQLTTGSTVSEFERALETMTAGNTEPKLIESRFGFHLVVVDRKIDGEQLPFEHVQARIAAWLDATAWSKAVAQYISILAGKADIQGVDMEASHGYLVQ
jgi:peptidyl-prolyl cis-trans isomerase C